MKFISASWFRILNVIYVFLQRQQYQGRRVQYGTEQRADLSPCLREQAQLNAPRDYDLHRGYAVTSTPLDSLTRAIFLRAELGFFGVAVYTRVQTPRFCGQLLRAGAELLFF